MGLISLLTSKLLKLPDPVYKKIAVEKDIRVPMRDGVSLLADRYYPANDEKCPLILVRSFYGRKGIFGFAFGRLIAEQGFQVLIQSCRGTFGSEGEFLPLLNERDDGLDTVGWLKEQDWFPGEFATTGPSYLGFVQWAIAGEAGPEHKAMSVQISASNFRGMGFPGDSFALKTVLTWTYLVNKQNSDFEALMAMLSMPFKLRNIYNRLPLNEFDNITLKKQVDFWQLLLVMGEPVNKEYTAADFSEKIPDITAPVSFQGGWCDIFLPWLIKDFNVLCEAGYEPHIIIGPWTHMNLQGGIAGLRDSICWLRAHMLEDKFLLREKPVKLFVMGAREWMDYEKWPPRDVRYEKWYFHSEKSLGINEPGGSVPDSYIYDPADPTPTVGGPTLFELKGFRDNRIIEKRDDVLIYNSAEMERGLELTGPVTAELFVRSSCEYTDFFVRICDVHPGGKSVNVCDGLQRITPDYCEPYSDGIMKVVVEMWPTAYYFRRGHRIRVQVSSGAHPRFAFNTGTGDPLATAKNLKSAHQEIYHDPDHPSAVILPVIERDDIKTEEGSTVKCVWCNDDDGIFEEMRVPHLGSDKADEKNKVETVFVHPRHNTKAFGYLTRVERIKSSFLAILVLDLILSVTGLSVILLEGWLGLDNTFFVLMLIGFMMVPLSFFILAFPYAVNNIMIHSLGIRRAVLTLRILATGMLILGMWFIIYEFNMFS